eukprot:764760-Hanusia_phi.AAC.2
MARDWKLREGKMGGWDGRGEERRGGERREERREKERRGKRGGDERGGKRRGGRGGEEDAKDKFRLTCSLHRILRSRRIDLCTSGGNAG